ncbi:serine protease hepsin-like [Babylonia areolata]|uniref:serine protease hepsin-like n=1 Tax=Babylonia areolata TaxID=304850 RepID=UPI003FD416E0
MGRNWKLVLLAVFAIHGRGGGGQRAEPEGCTPRSLVPDCGHPAVQPASSRVVGGHEALRGAWPWTVALTKDDFATCGGAIITDRVIMTAAHCFEDPISQNASSWKALAGMHNLHRTDQGQMAFSVEKIIMHERYQHKTVENDIALLIVKDRIPFTTFIRPICMPHGAAVTSPVPVGTPCLLAGWGRTKGTGPEGVLMEVTLPVISDQVCGQPGWYYHHFIPQKTFCAGYEGGGKDACVGDSGSPLISKSDDGRWYVNGIASWGYGCAEPRWPGVYTNVTDYLPWIHTQLVDNALPGLCQDSPIG